MYKQIENSKGELAFFRQVGRSRYAVGAYMLTPWGAGPFFIGTEFGDKAAMENYYSELSAKIRACKD